ncbi:hypothetical protein DNTS_003476 [Danionella cerebrum]|uniref:L27 domain-containing protein n=1 Tax=Danionella cerebrum TaxID=2873325 RepID=A0A553QH99_9TELE|nr:hypothetical protein DNTS_003476 [Danionella translucida]
MPVRKKDAQKALRLLEEYQTKLSQTGDPHLRFSIERVIRIFKSTLFHALIDIQEYYEESLWDPEKPFEQSNLKSRESLPPVNEWNLTAPPSTTEQTEPYECRHPPPPPQQQRQQHLRYTAAHRCHGVMCTSHCLVCVDGA